MKLSTPYCLKTLKTSVSKYEFNNNKDLQQKNVHLFLTFIHIVWKT